MRPCTYVCPVFNNSFRYRISTTSLGMTTKQRFPYLALAIARLITISITLSLLVSAWCFSDLDDFNTVRPTSFHWQKPRNIASLKQPRQVPIEQKHVILPTFRNYTEDGELDLAVYTRLNFGPDSQPLNLGLSARHETWVPDIESKERFCGDQSVNTKTCNLARISGYYSPNGNSTNIPFTLRSGSSASDLIRGYFYDDVVTTNGVSVNLRFGVGDTWDVPPFLGLGIATSRENVSSSMSYTAALVEQGKIFEPYISFYDIRNPRGTGGQIVIGGVDRKKLYGGFTYWKGIGAPGEVPTPKIKVVANDGFEELYHKFVQPKKATALISPGTPFIVVPSDVLESLRFAVPIAFPIGSSDIKNYLYTTCDGTIDPSIAIEFDFQTVVIRIPLEDLKTVAPPRVYSSLGGIVANYSNICILSISSTDDIKGYSFILGGPFLRKVST
ncbi:hypothetical protein TWF569_002969 [Orbilia oligospora]|nr:hypothetical protein TWF569_002969 [Orbilia oligospora]